MRAFPGTELNSSPWHDEGQSGRETALPEEGLTVRTILPLSAKADLGISQACCLKPRYQAAPLALWGKTVFVEAC